MNKKYIRCNELRTQKHLKESFWQQYFVVCSLDFLWILGETPKNS